MAGRDEIVRFCDELLDAPAFDDYGPNGLQVPGDAEVTKLVTGVSAHRELLERAVEAGAQLALVHHGLFWDSLPRALSEPMAERLRVALSARLSVGAYHLPLDAHPEVGNNALLAGALGCVDHIPFAGIGRGGTFAEPVAAADLFARVRGVTGREPLVFDGGPPEIRRIAIISGAAAGRLPQAVAEGYDAFLTGEPKENVMADAREAGIHFIAAGHYATETFGVRRLGDLLAERFGIEHVWVDIPNPV